MEDDSQLLITFFHFYTLFSFKIASCGQYFPVSVVKIFKLKILSYKLVACRWIIANLTQSQLQRMGCAGSSQTKAESEKGGVKQIRKPRSWKHPQPITISQLIQLREEFWDTAPHYGGRKEIWDALRAAAEADPSFAKVIIENAGIILQNPDMTLCFDESGARYELPTYVLSEPKNLIRDS